MIYRTGYFDMPFLRSRATDLLATEAELASVLNLLSSDGYAASTTSEGALPAIARHLTSAECASEMVQVLTGWRSKQLTLIAQGVHVFVSLDADMPVPYKVDGSIRVEAAGGAKAFRLLESMTGVKSEGAWHQGRFGCIWDRVRVLIPGMQMIEFSPRLELLLNMFGVAPARRLATARARRILSWGGGITLEEDVSYVLRRGDANVKELLEWAEDVARHMSRRSPRRPSRLARRSTDASWVVEVVIISNGQSPWDPGRDPLPRADFTALLRVGVGDGVDEVKDEEIGLTARRKGAHVQNVAYPQERTRFLEGTDSNGPVWAWSLARKS